MEYKLEQRKHNTLVIKLEGRMTGEYQTVDLTEILDEHIEDGFIHIVFDLGDLAFINSSGLNFMLKTLTKVRRLDGEVVLCDMNDLLKTLMVTTKLNSFFTISDNLGDALAHLEREKA